MTTLTKQQQVFISEYFVDYNGRQAAIRAGYTPEHAEKQAYRLLQQPHIKALVSEQVEARLERTSVTADWVLSRLKAEALDRSEGSSHGARVSSLIQLSKILGMLAPVPAEASRVNFFIDLGQSERVINSTLAE